MTAALRVPKDSERVVRDYLATALAERHPAVTVRVGVPTDWAPGSPVNVQVSDDGTSPWHWPVATLSPIRIVVWSDSTTKSKALAGFCGALLDRHSGDGIAFAKWQTGPMTAKDADNHAELAYVTAGVKLRSVPLV